MGLPQDNSFLLKINICITLEGMQVFQHEGMILVLHFTCFNKESNGMLTWNLGFRIIRAGTQILTCIASMALVLSEEVAKLSLLVGVARRSN